MKLTPNWAICAPPSGVPFTAAGQISLLQVTPLFDDAYSAVCSEAPVVPDEAAVAVGSTIVAVAVGPEAAGIVGVTAADSGAIWVTTYAYCAFAPVNNCALALDGICAPMGIDVTKLHSWPKSLV